MRKQVIEEFDLLEYTCCPMRLKGGVSYATDPTEAMVMDLASSMLMASFCGEKISLRQVRKQLDELNQQRAKPLPHMRIVRMSARLHELISRYRILQPVTPYQLHLGDVVIAGQYAVVQRVETKNEAAVLRIRNFNDELHSRPDIINYARWAHLVLYEMDFRRYLVVNWHLLKNFQWLEEYNEKTVRKAITTASRNFVGQSFYPAPGSHCRNCLTKACAEV